MFEVDIKVNGTTIGVLHGRNAISIDSDVCLYEYYYHDFKAHRVHTGEIYHERKDGILALLTMILNLIDEKK